MSDQRRFDFAPSTKEQGLENLFRSLLKTGEQAFENCKQTNPSASDLTAKQAWMKAMTDGLQSSGLFKGLSVVDVDIKSGCFRIRDCHSLRLAFPCHSSRHRIDNFFGLSR